MHWRVATLVLVLCLAAGCSRCSSERRDAASPAPTIELQPGALLIDGNVVAGPGLAGTAGHLAAHREALRSALQRTQPRAPLIRVAPTVTYEALFDAVQVAAKQQSELNLARGQPDDGLEIPVALQCAGSSAEWTVRASTPRGLGVHPPNQQTDLLFSIALTPTGFFLATVEGVLSPGPSGRVEVDSMKQAAPPTVPLKDGRLDLLTLRARVAELSAKFPTEQSVFLAADQRTTTAQDVCLTLEAVTPSFPRVFLKSL